VFALAIVGAAALVARTLDNTRLVRLRRKRHL
jgi:hypothetical protein